MGHLAGAKIAYDPLCRSPRKPAPITNSESAAIKEKPRIERYGDLISPQPSACYTFCSTFGLSSPPTRCAPESLISRGFTDEKGVPAFHDKSPD